ncbi:hypothetical protein L6164_016674 [Bauhinia variegata]|uniref:Uncharacterized protein n=1 Tax=Bauhinia variegata TaxID=167791 RepID=A0ACB9NSG8_BAUVA|nr:hypothetical protein L6164_016674 [Bauhinia variegata]
MERMANIWRPGRGVTIREINPRVFLFQFYHKLDITWVFNGGPWSFDNHMLILELVKPGYIVSKIPLFHVYFWVQIHDLPAEFITPIIGKHLGNFIGSFVEYDENNNTGGWRTFMRIKVRVNVRLPLKKVKNLGGEWSDDGARGWGPEIKVETRREGGDGSQWLKEGQAEWSRQSTTDHITNVGVTGG